MNDWQIMKAHKIARHYGLSKQRFQALQEFNELCALLLRRKDQIPNREEYRNNLVDEIADCYVMLEQLELLYRLDGDEINDRINFKLNRQLERMNNE